MSSTFSYKDDLIERVLTEPTRDARFYLDSGWPNDNYEVTTEMALALVNKGWRYGCDFINLVFPHAVHDEKAWGMRLHLPVQFFTGAVARASRAMISYRVSTATSNLVINRITENIVSIVNFCDLRLKVGARG